MQTRRKNYERARVRRSFQDDVMINVMRQWNRMKQWNRMRQRQMNQPKSAGEGNKMKIISNIEDHRGIDIKAGDSDDDKTVMASNTTWEEHAMYAGRDGHYEEFEQYDSWNDGYSRPDGEWDESWAENDPEPPIYEEQRWQPEYACNEQGCSRDMRHEYMSKMPQQTMEMENNRLWQSNWSNAQYTGRGAAWQTICK